MKETIVYSKKYNEEDNYYKLKELIKNNLLVNENYTPSERLEQKFIGIEDNVIVRLSMKFNTGIINSSHDSNITVEKVGSNAKKITEIETILLKEGFKPESK
jgi:hypothetical protein